MRQIPRTCRRRGFTIKDLAVAVTCVLLATCMLASLSGANRGLSQASVCAANLHTLFGGLVAYVNTYNSYPPHSPYPTYEPPPYETVNGISVYGFDPNIGWILTYGLGLTPPGKYSDGHFKWFGIDDISELPQEVICPAAKLDNLFTPNPEIDANNIESFVSKYAAFYQTSGTCRAATPVKTQQLGSVSLGGRNPAIPNPNSSLAAQTADNTEGGSPYVWLYSHSSSSADPNMFGGERSCWVQAVCPAEVQDPGRVYYLADSRDYRPTPGSWPSAGINDGWRSAYGNQVLLGTRHYGYSNIMYLDGRVSRDNQAHRDARWNLDYDSTTYTARSDQWRCATFADNIQMANIRNQHHIMPVLMIKGWERLFGADGLEPGK